MLSTISTLARPSDDKRGRHWLSGAIEFDHHFRDVPGLYRSLGSCSDSVLSAEQKSIRVRELLCLAGRTSRVLLEIV